MTGFEKKTFGPVALGQSLFFFMQKKMISVSDFEIKPPKFSKLSRDAGGIAVEWAANNGAEFVCCQISGSRSALTEFDIIYI